MICNNIDFQAGGTEMRLLKSDDGLRKVVFPLGMNEEKRKSLVVRVSTVLNGTTIARRRVAVPNSE